MDKAFAPVIENGKDMNDSVQAIYAIKDGVYFRHDVTPDSDILHRVRISMWEKL
jgi:hypothetical protein